MLKNTVGLSFGVASALLGAAMFFLPACGGTSEDTGCTPNETKSCACPGGREGSQTCSGDGSTYSVCNCSDGNGGSGAGTNTTGNGASGGQGGQGGGETGLCGNGIPDPGECDGGEFPCPQDCMLTSTSTGMTTTTSTTDPCQGHIAFAGMIMGVTSAWGNHPQANGKIGYEAGIEICKTIGADHPCDYEEVLDAETAGELANIPQGTTAWIHRTTVAMVDGNPSDPGPGGRCNDWIYTTNHISDGEFVNFAQTGIPTYNLDNETKFDGMTTAYAQTGKLQCNGETRAILCCFPACQ